MVVLYCVMNRHLYAAALFLLTGLIQAQNAELKNYFIDGEVVTAIIDECGDTIFVKELVNVTVSAPRKFENRQEYLIYQRYRKYAAIVYPYAVKSIRLFRELERDSEELTKRQRKRHIRKLKKEYKKEFKEPTQEAYQNAGQDFDENDRERVGHVYV